MRGAVGRVLAPLAALALVVMGVYLLGSSDLLAGQARTADSAGPPTPTTIIELALPNPGEGAEADDVGSDGTTVGVEGGSVPSTADPMPTETNGDQSPAEPGTEGDETTYTVQEGDSPYSIAQEFGVSTQRLMEFNGIDDARTLQVGTVIRIPSD